MIHDQGGEFFKDFQTACRAYGVQTHCTATESPWQNALVERHGAVLGEVLSIMTETCALVGPEDMKHAATFAAKAKNRRITRTGKSARSRVFGTDERWPGGVVEEDFVVLPAGLRQRGGLRVQGV